jgi:excinuclease ABC subunit C
MAIKAILKSKSKEFQNKIKTAPKTPGCYIYFDEEEKPIYVGKANNLRNRLNSYFLNFFQMDLAKQIMIENAQDVKFYQVDSEFEALILENNLIKKYLPKYNVLLKDDKNYIYVRFERVRKSNMKIPTKFSSYQDFPRIKVVRSIKNDGAEYFGPYPDGRPVLKILRKLRKIYPYRVDNNLVYIKDNGEIHTSEKKPSLFYHIGLSRGAEAGLETKEEYIKRFNEVRKFFRGEKQSLINNYEKQMIEASKSQNFELAAQLRDKIRDLKYIAKNIVINELVDDTVVENLKENLREEAIEKLIEELDFPKDKIKNHPGFRIECYDISNFQGKEAVGAMVVMIDGQIRPELYRRFKIRTKNTPDDFAMHQEVLTRRFRNFILTNQENNIDNYYFDDEALEYQKNLMKKAKNWKEDESFRQKPDLIIIDGGKGQLASAYRILRAYNLHNEIPIVGLAKKEEELFKFTDQFKDFDQQVSHLEDSDRFTRIYLPRKTEALFMVQRIRDEAHRFGITYHRNLRSASLLGKQV